MLQSNTNTNKRILITTFMKWPLAKRQDFIDREMSGCPDFIKTPLLRHSAIRKAKNLASARFFVSIS